MPAPATDQFTGLIDVTHWTEDDWVAYDKARNPDAKRIVKHGRWYGGDDVTFSCEGSTLTIHASSCDVELECGHHATYRSSGLIPSTMECAICKAAALPA